MICLVKTRFPHFYSIGKSRWQVLSRCYLTPRQWVFAQFTQVDPNSEMDIVFLILRYCGLRHNWNMRNAFVFDGRHGMKAYLRKLKGVVMWQIIYWSKWNFFPQWSVRLAYWRFNMFHYPCSVVSGWPYSIVTPIVSSVFHTHFINIIVCFL